ncbi:MAG: tetrathionate reductase family octaheme c-type cytochrome [Deltaproteobacteria bacterium]|nr:tetrathionate reductase family octaheme c-type cytochrome [Deltaproteobacteria bacterium]
MYRQATGALALSLVALAWSSPASAGDALDHSQFVELQQPFETPEQVTEACQSCHLDVAEDIHHTKHWMWQTDDVAGSGKRTSMNNFCLNVAGNWPRCTSCHIGYGYSDNKFDFQADNKIDCLVCHDTTGTYKKFPTKAGYPVLEDTDFMGKTFKAVDLTHVALNVGEVGRDNCGTCHFYGGGGDGVKHGDMDSSLKKPSRSLDVHMDVDGLNFSCVDCHETEDHQVGGGTSQRLPEGHASKAPVVACENCHTETPHSQSEHSARLNDHTGTVACQTCHIPEYARGGVPTKMQWDWSQAGQMGEDGKPLVKKDEHGHQIYNGMKGAFVMGENMVPTYTWWNGNWSSLTYDDVIDPSTVLGMRTPNGGPGDGKIFPFKVHHGTQPYDKVANVLIAPKLFGKPGSGAYWKDYDWNAAAAAGMKLTGHEFSGELGWVESDMYWDQNHMVAPREDALDCADCHAENGRLAGIPGVYIPGQSRSGLVDMLGWLVIGLSGLGAVGHGGARMIFGRKK